MKSLDKVYIYGIDVERKLRCANDDDDDDEDACHVDDDDDYHNNDEITIQLSLMC